MSGRLVVLTGVHRLVRGMFDLGAGPSNRIFYFNSIADELGVGSAVTDSDFVAFPDYRVVMDRESARDAQLLYALMQIHATAICEQWHIGNTAWAKARRSPASSEYESKLPALVEPLASQGLQIWYISTDVDKYFSSAFRVVYLQYLQELSAIVEGLKLQLKTVDGDAPVELLRKRLIYLLESTGSGT